MKKLIKKIPGTLRTKQWIDLQRVKRRKWPENVWISTTSYCNNDCLMCSIDKKAPKHTLSVNQIAKWTWLKHVKFVGIWAGCGEPTLNPELPSMLEMFSVNLPHIKLHLSTNGTHLSPWLANKVHYLNVSLNAASDRLWHKINRPPDGMKLRNITDVLAKRNKKRADLSISMIMTEENLTDVLDFVELAAVLDATCVLGYCMYHSWTGTRKLNSNSSIYLMPDRVDGILKEARRRAKDWGVKLWAPPLFSEPSTICRGTRVGVPMPYCYDPFRNLYLSVDEHGARSAIVCCSGTYFDIPWDPDNLDADELQRIWHNDEFEHLRRTVNEQYVTRQNALCSWCKSVDRYHPDNEKSYFDIVNRVKEHKWWRR